MNPGKLSERIGVFLAKIRIWSKVYRFLKFVESYLPEPVFLRLKQFFWHSFWIKEELEEEKELGIKPSSSIAGSERAILAEAIGEVYPFDSLLEVGCGFGQGFYTFVELFSRVSFCGVDANERRVKEGNALLEKRGLSNVKLYTADAESLPFEDDSFEIVVSSGFMLFVPPEKTEKVLSEMLRICRRRIFMLEQHQDANFTLNNNISTYVARKNSPEGYWLHDFNLLFSKQPLVRKVIIRAIPQPRWNLEHWKTNAAVIEVRK